MSSRLGVGSLGLWENELKKKKTITRSRNQREREREREESETHLWLVPLGCYLSSICSNVDDLLEEFDCVVIGVLPIHLNAYLLVLESSICVQNTLERLDPNLQITNSSLMSNN